MAFKTLKVRVKDKHAPTLINMARSVNVVWNYINELSSRAIRERGAFLSAYDINKYTVGAHRELGVHSHTPQVVAKEYVKSRRQCRARSLSWRVSSRASPRYSLGWVPVNTGMATWKRGQVYHCGHYFGVWDSYGLAGDKFRSASFNEDSRGRWYFNVLVDVEEKLSSGQEAIGIDLGLKEIATCSDGTELGSGRWYRGAEKQLAVAQRARKKQRVKAIHAKIANRRKDALHKFSRQLVDRCGEIYIGNISSSKLIKTNMAKSVLDAGWSSLKTMLEYKGAYAGIVVGVVNESNSTQTCSCCGEISTNSPKGRAGLRIREWTCMVCGSTHDRDINAAKNILAAGHCRLAGGIIHQLVCDDAKPGNREYSGLMY